MNVSGCWAAKVGLVIFQQGHAVIQQIQPIYHRQAAPVEFGIAPKYGEGFAKIRVQILGFCDEPRDLRWRLLTVKQQTHVDIAVDGTEAAVGEAAELVHFDQRRPQLRGEVFGDARNVVVISFIGFQDREISFPSGSSFHLTKWSYAWQKKSRVAAGDVDSFRLPS